MLKSMTGFGRAEKQDGAVSCKAEVRSVNGRFLEINARLPKALSTLDPQIRKLAKTFCARGSLDVSVVLEKNNGVPAEMEIKPNLALAAQYVGALGQIKRQLGLTGEIDINAVLSIRDILKFEPTSTGPAEEEIVLGTVEEALAALARMRAEEGKNLRKDFLERIDYLEKLCRAIKERQPAVLQEYKERLQEKIKALTGGLELDGVRLAQETAILADRCDVTEEITRLESHIQQFRGLLDDKESQGRKLEFITQEINRETNTIGSKSVDSQVSQHVIEIKCVLEKIREQLQNIE
ncbi:MAG: YicC family protein [Nitrospinae bacterium]|nr:YicC family protein [Nitrospinota bacterium]